MIRNSFIIPVLLFALLLAKSDLVSAERSLNSKGGKGKGGKGKGGKSDLSTHADSVTAPTLADSETAYKYSYLTDSFFVEVDNIVNEKPGNVTAFYYSRIAPRCTDDVTWFIQTPIITSVLNGTEQALTFWKTIAARRFSNHALSFLTVKTIGNEVQVEYRYHGIVLPAANATTNPNFQDIFGRTRAIYNEYGLISDVFVNRNYTIDRGYGVK